MTQICLISGQLMPNLLSLSQFPAEHILLVHSKDTKHHAEHFASFLSRGSPFADPELVEVDAFDPDQIISSALQLQEKLKESSVTLNYTGGTKQQSVLFFKLFSESNARLIYTDTQQNCFWILENRNVSREPLQITVSFSDLFQLLNYEVIDCTEKRELAELAEFSSYILEEKKKGKGFLLKSLLDSAVKARRAGGSPNQWNPAFATQEFSIQTSKDEVECHWKGNRLSDRPKQFWMEYLSGGWFEFACHDILLKSRLFHDLICNLKIKPAEKSSKETVQNEIDIAGISGTVPFFFECKSGKTDQKSITNLKAMRDRYGPSYSHSVLISYWPVKDPVLKTKLDDYQIDLVEGPENLEENILHVCKKRSVKI